MPALLAIATFLGTVAQYAPLIFGFISTAENAATAAGTVKAGPAKLAAVAKAVVAVAPDVAALIQANPDHSNHLNDYISASVGIVNDLNGWAATQIAVNNQQAASGA